MLTNKLLSTPVMSLKGSMLFDDSQNQYASMDASASDISGIDCTIEAFFLLKGYSRSYNGEYAGAIMGSATGSGSGWELTVRGNSSSYSIINLARGGGNLLISHSTSISLNTWYHVAVTKVGSTNQYRMYLNGSLVSSRTETNYTSWTLGGPFMIGAIPAGGYEYYFDGHVSNVRIIRNSIVTPTTRPTSPLEPVTGTSVLAAQGNGFVDRSPNNYAINAVNGASNSLFGPF